MDEEKTTTTQEAQEATEVPEESVWKYPFVVEITAAMLLDGLGNEKAKEWTEEPSLRDNVHILVEFIGTQTRELIDQHEITAREETPFVKFYEEIPGYRPELDPDSAAFELDQYNAAINEIGEGLFLDGVVTRLKEMIKEQEAMTKMLPELQGFGFELQKVLAGLLQYLNSDRFLEVIR